MSTSRARALRKNLTDAEQKLWRRLKQRQIAGHKFRRQQPIGAYIVDFVCLEQNLIIELDGGQHAEQSIYDEKRTNWLESRGYRVLRFWNNEVIGNTDGVVQAIMDSLQSNQKVQRHPPLNPPPQGGRRFLGKGLQAWN